MLDGIKSRDISLFPDSIFSVGMALNSPELARRARGFPLIWLNNVNISLLARLFSLLSQRVWDTVYFEVEMGSLPNKNAMAVLIVWLGLMCQRSRLLIPFNFS
jgi:hypothetical protein